MPGPEDSAAAPRDRVGRPGEPPARRLRVAVLQELPTPYRWPLLRRIAREGSVDLTVLFYARTEGDRPWDLAPASEPGGPAVEYLPGSTRHVGGERSLYFHWNPSVARRLREGGFDVVVLPGWSMPTTIRAWLHCRSRGTPYVVFSETHGLRRRSAALRFGKRLLLRPLVGGASACLATGTLARDYLVAHGARPERVFRFPNAPDVAALASAVAAARPSRGAVRAALDTPADATVALFVGRLLPAKDPRTLLDAQALLEARSPDGAPWLWFVGDGPEAKTLREVTEARKLGRVRFAGARRPEEIPAFWAAADLFVLPSVHEPWGAVVNEAMAAGLPVVLSDRVGAAPDLLRDGEDGRGFPAGDVEALAAVLAELHGDPARRRAMGEASRRIVADWGHEAAVRGFLDAVRAASEARP